jgi:hypothetical protein
MITKLERMRNKDKAAAERNASQFGTLSVSAAYFDGKVDMAETVIKWLREETNG